ncbi:hypothetical protein LCGC14_2206520 [marine sediment metagenome]|uniref:Uncharacterized protein n=1 Tax=marine sediment metagenome TaxID=412755 RepID=A0A0F9DFC4_9ZZZZ
MGGKTKIQMRSDLRTDLKDSGSLWSNPELDRCIERAHSDLSRFLPRERQYEETLVFAVTGESVTFPVDTDADRIVDNADISATADGGTLTIAAQPDVPRVLTLTITDASGNITNMSVIVKGSDRNDKAVDETFHWAKGSGVITGLKYFKTVNEVEVDQIDGNSAGETLDLGVGAYTDVWVDLANKPVKWATDSGTDDASNGLSRNTDYRIDYINGRVKAIGSQNIAAAEVCTFAYTKIQVGIDLSALADFIRVVRVEYPVDPVPQNFVSQDMFGSVVYITGGGEATEQVQLAEGQNVRVYYDAEHISPNDYAPGTAPEFLENTVLLAAGAYALVIYALKQEHQAETDAASARTALAAASTAQTALDTALSNIKKYLDNNSEADAVGILKDITDDAAKLRTRIDSLMSLSNTYVFGDTAPSAKKYLDDGDATLNVNNVGGEGTTVPQAYVQYANASVQLFSGLVAEANSRISNLRTYIEQAAGYNNIANTFAREAEDSIAKVNSLIQEAAGYIQAAGTELVLADRYRAESIDRHNRAESIWRDRKQYIGDFVGSSVRQMPSFDNRSSGYL